MKFLKYEPTFDYVHVPMIAATFAIIILIYFFVLKPTPSGKLLGNTSWAGGPPNSPGMSFLSYSGWFAAQEQATGAEIGYAKGKPQVLMPYNETIGGTPYVFKDV